MRLYQYTGWDHVDGIKSNGITDGAIYLPLAKGWLNVPNIQWLTDDDDWFNQKWATNKLLKNHERTTVRFEVVIPKTARHKLHRWNEYARQVLKTPQPYLDMFNQEGGSDGRHWWVFDGRIPPAWLRGFEERPTAMHFLAAAHQSEVTR